MKVLFELKLMYDEGSFKEFSKITENEKEIDFLTSFFRNFSRKDLIYFYDAPSYLNTVSKEKREEIVLKINELISLANSLNEEEQIILIKEDFDIGIIYTLLLKVLHFVDEYFKWSMYNYQLESFGEVKEYEIKDISNKVVLSKKEALKLLKEKLNIDAILVD